MEISIGWSSSSQRTTGRTEQASLHPTLPQLCSWTKSPNSRYTDRDAVVPRPSLFSEESTSFWSGKTTMTSYIKPMWCVTMWARWFGRAPGATFWSLISGERFPPESLLASYIIALLRQDILSWWWPTAAILVSVTTTQRHSPCREIFQTHRNNNLWKVEGPG